MTPKPRSRGLLVTIEGGEGSGKTSQQRRLGEALRARSRPVLCTREPGGTPGGEALRELLLGGAVDRWSPAAELMLLNAARVDHVERLIGPALAAGTLVLCDRYVDSTRVYQGLVGGLTTTAIDRLHRDILGLPWPDLTLLLDLDPAAGLARRRAVGGDTRFERKGDSFHQQVRHGFLQLARAEAGRIRVIDAARPADEVGADMLASLEELLAAADAG